MTDPTYCSPERQIVRAPYLLLGTLAYAPVVVFGLLATPLVGNILFLGFGDLIGCSGNAGGPKPCDFLGNDVGSIYHDYAVSMVIFGLTNPLSAISFFLTAVPLPLLAAWMLVFAVFEWHRSGRKQERARGSHR